MHQSTAIAEAILLAERNHLGARRQLAEAFERDQCGFASACAEQILASPERTGAQVALAFLIGKGQLDDILLNGRLTAEQGGQLLRLARRIDPSIEVSLLRSCDPDNDPDSLLRLMEILVRASHEKLILEILTRLGRHENPYIRSKAELLRGRIEQNYERIEARLADPDYRIAANAVESLWGQRGERAERIFRLALNHPQNRVQGNGAVGLYRAGKPEALPFLLAMAEHPDPAFRATAFKAMEFTGDVRFLPRLADWMGKAPAPERRRIFQAIRSIRETRQRVLAAGQLQICISRAARSPNGQHRIRFSVIDRRTSQILTDEDILGTSVVLVADGQPLLDYELESRHPRNPAAIQVLLPTARDNSLPALDALSRPSDCWEFHPFDGAPPDERVTAALDRLQSFAADRHLIICASRPEQLQLGPDVLTAAGSAQVTIHAVLPTEAPPAWLLRMEGVARETGGFAIREDSLSEALAVVLSGIVGSFELTFQRSGEAPLSEVQLQVYASQGFAETSAFFGQAA